MTRPSVLGQPCWTAEAVDQTITSIARLDPRLSHYFLATHTPIEEIQDDQHNETLTEGDLFESLFGVHNADAFAVLHGDPGTGKSHLIRWLHLRCLVEQSFGRLANLFPVLIQRRTGSLRDALRQIVEQLPERFERHLATIQEAIAALSQGTARELLVNALQIELGPRAVEEGGVVVPPELRGLEEICRSNGFRTWLCRDGGAIDRTIRQLTEESDVLERQTLPAFEALDLAIPDRLRPDNTNRTLALIDEFEFDTDLRQRAVECFNQAVRPAVSEMSGLSGTRLRDVFDSIRRELAVDGKVLAVFIEDVSVMASLDEDILNAVEPNPSPDLCRLIAIVGVTDEGFRRILDNQRDRATHIVSLSSQIMERWRRDTPLVTQFAARYLNAVRLDERGIERVAHGRRDDHDIIESACTTCAVRDECHRVFGAIEFEDVKVGLFPFTSVAPSRLLDALDERRPGIRQNPRGLLEHVLKPVLRDARSLEKGEFPSAVLATRLSEPAYWTAFEGRYCGGWTARDRSRLKLLAQGWISVGSATAVPAALSALLKPLRFPAFTEEVGEPRPRDDRPVRPPPPPPDVPPPPPELQQLLDSLGAWLTGARLDRDEEPRELVLELIRHGIPWDDETIPVQVWSRLLKEKRCIRFEKQRARPAGTFFIDLLCTAESTELVEALARHKYEGGGTWHFEHAETFKRTVSNWLRRHRPEIVSSMRPPSALGEEQPLQYAVRLLYAAALIRRRDGLPDNPGEVLRELLADVEPSAERGVNEEDDSVIKQLLGSQDQIKRFVIGEVSRRQGGVKGTDVFIDPLPVLRAHQAVREIVVPPLEEEYFSRSRHWQSRYDVIRVSSMLADVRQAVQARRTFLAKKIAVIRSNLADAGYGEDALARTAPLFFAELADFAEVEKAIVALPSAAFAEIERRLAAMGRTWSKTLAATETVVLGGDPWGLLSLDTAGVVDALKAFEGAWEFVCAVEKELVRQEAHFTEDGDPVAMLAAIRSALQTIADSGDGLSKI